MLPLSPAYFAFAAVAITLYWLCYRWTAARLVILVAANFFFLARFAWFYPVLLLVAATIDYRIGIELQELPRRPDFTRRRRQFVTLSLLVNLGLLTATKLLPLGYDQLYHWVLPLSLSFYCFQSLTYTIDLYRGTKPGTRSYLEHLTAATLFSVIVAGPINRVSDLIRQLRQPFALTSTEGGRAFLLIASGLMKKLLIADFLSENVVNRIFDTPTLYSGAEVLFGVYCYALQIYFDFSGYTDIAMGVSQLLGLQVPDNFNRPYWSASIQEFWQRWHITFSHWLRDYVYFSLPSTRKRKWLNYVYPFIVMILGGLWHGASWMFVLWGGLHGAYLVMEKVAQHFATPKPVFRIGKSCFIFLIVTLTWIPFRSSSPHQAFEIIRGLINVDELGQVDLPKILAVLIMGLTVRWHILMKGMRFDFVVQKNSATVAVVSGVLAMVSLFLFSSGNSNAFIYFQF